MMNRTLPPLLCLPWLAVRLQPSYRPRGVAVELVEDHEGGYVMVEPAANHAASVPVHILSVRVGGVPQ